MRHIGTSVRFCLLAALLCCLAGPLAADEKAAKERVGVGKLVTAPGTLLRREAFGKPWHGVLPKDPLLSEYLLLGLPGASIDNKAGTVRLTFLTDFEQQSPFPVLECAVILHDTPGVDLDFTLDRGRADVVNRKEKGEASVRVRVRDQIFDVALAEPGTRVAFELYGRWAKGVPFTKDPKPDHVPVADMVILVLKGSADLKHGSRTQAMHAPPGPALWHWDSLRGGATTPTKLETLPAWAGAEGQFPAEAKARLEAFRKLAAEKSTGAALEAFLASDNEKSRRLAIVAMAAMDDLPRLGPVLLATKHPDVLENGILAFRHWLGRSPGQDQKLYKMLIEERKYSPAHAAIIMQLLHSFGDEDLARPETYEVLIDYLDHEQQSIRFLAHWHLVRLVPAGKKIDFKALDSKEAREKAIAEWKKLIPTGKLPPKTTTDGK